VRTGVAAKREQPRPPDGMRAYSRFVEPLVSGGAKSGRLYGVARWTPPVGGGTLSGDGFSAVTPESRKGNPKVQHAMACAVNQVRLVRIALACGFVFGLLLQGISDAAGPEVRTWTDSTGRFKREGVFQRIDGKSVVIRTTGGAEVTIPLDRLCSDDQAYAASAASAAESDDPFKAVSGDPVQPGDLAKKTDVPATVGDVRVVVVEGAGTSVEDAKADAYREAVRQVVGAYVEADTLTKNDELIEDKVVALSGGFVQKADVLPASVKTVGGLTRVRVRAEVKVTEVMKSLARLNVTSTPVRGSDLAAQVATLGEQTDSAEALLADERTWEGFPATFFNMNLVGQPKILEAQGDVSKAELIVRITPNREKYFTFADRLASILAKVALKSGEFSNNGIEPAGDSRSAGAYMEALYHHVFHGAGGYDRADPAVSGAFPEKYRRDLKAHFKSMDAEELLKNGSIAYCFDQGSNSTHSGCGLRISQKQWNQDIGDQHQDLMVVCLLTQANDTFVRTQWRWFLCRRALFPRKDASPWDRGIECEISLCNANGREITSASIPLGEGFGVSRCDWRRYRAIAILGPMWIDPDEIDRKGYAPSIAFPVRVDLSAAEAKSLSEVKCSVRPLAVSPD